jgi:hypothetical protein
MKVAAPKRIQRKRIKGWNMPPNTIYVGRPTKWGNPFRAKGHARKAVSLYRLMVTKRISESTINRVMKSIGVKVLSDQSAIGIFQHLIAGAIMNKNLHELRGKNLACWCPLDRPCHADVLLELANKGRQ